MDFEHVPAGHRPIDDIGERPPAQVAFFTFLRAMQLHRQLMSRNMIESGIAPSQSFALREIGHCDGITQRDLADKLNISRPTLTVMLQKMEKAKLVERRADADDQRYTRIHLTEKGAQMHEAMHDVLHTSVDQAFGTLDEAEQVEFTRILAKVNDNLAAVLGADAPAPGRPAHHPSGKGL